MGKWLVGYNYFVPCGDSQALVPFGAVNNRYSKMSLLRPLEIKTTSLLRPVFASPKRYLPYDIIFDIKTTSLIRPFFDSQKVVLL